MRKDPSSHIQRGEHTICQLSFCDTVYIRLPRNRFVLQILSDAHYFTPRNTLAYRLRAAEDAVIDMQSMIFKNCVDAVPSRYMQVYSQPALHHPAQATHPVLLHNILQSSLVVHQRMQKVKRCQSQVSHIHRNVAAPIRF